MEIRPLPADEAAVRRYVESLWLPYNRELEATVEDHALAPDVDLVAAEVEYRLDLLATGSHRTWIAVDSGGEDCTGVDVDDATLAGFVTTDLEESPPVFDRPDRLVVGDLYVREPYRGSGLATTLLETAAERGRDVGCGEVVLDVDVGNERAVAFYRKHGFEPVRRRMAVDVDDL